jgi:NitT/TauT family transport system permease protein
LICGFLLLVECSVRLGWISSFFLASPLQALGALWAQIVGGNALLLTAITLYEIFAALLISTVFGLLAGFLLWRYRLIGTSYEMPLAALFSSPVILAYPVFLVTFGRTSAAVIALSSIFGLIPIIINTKGAFQTVNPILLEVGASMNLSAKQMFRHILLPAAAPMVFSGFRLALTYILKSVLGLEYVAQVGGVGMWLSDAAFRFEVQEVYAGLLGTISLSIFFLYLINRSESLVRR